MPSRTASAPRLSIVIPAADVAALEETLLTVLENRPADCEIVVALAVNYDDPWNIAEEVHFVATPAGSSRVACTNVGVAATTGEVVHVLAAGWRATAGWADAALAAFADPAVAAVVPVGVAADDPGRIVATGVRRSAGGRAGLIVPPRSRRRIESFDATAAAAPAAPALEAGFWRADVLADGGLATACGDDLATADASAAIACAGGRVVVEPESRVVWGVDAGRPAAFLAGLRAERLFWRSLAAEATVPALVAHLLEIVRHAVVAAPLATLPMLLGRLVAAMEFGSTWQRARELRGLRQAAAQDGVAESRRTVRIDAGHDGVAGPRAGRGAQAGLRRSA